MMPKSYFSVLVIALILGSIGWQSATIIHFYANQKEITEKYCVNKDKPQLHCNGKCHLKAQLNTTVKKDQPEKSRHIVSSILVFQGYEYLTEFQMPDKENSSQFDTNYLFSLKTVVLSGLLDPPEFS